MPSSACRVHVCVEIHMCVYVLHVCAYMYCMCLQTQNGCVVPQGCICIVSVRWVYPSVIHACIYPCIYPSEYVHLYRTSCLSLSLGRVTPDNDCVLLQEKFGCPQCKGIFHAGTQQKIGELTTDESGNQKPVLYGKSAHQVATNRMRV